MITIHTSKLLSTTKSKVRIRVVHVLDEVTTMKSIPKQSGSRAQSMKSCDFVPTTHIDEASYTQPYIHTLTARERKVG